VFAKEWKGSVSANVAQRRVVVVAVVELVVASLSLVPIPIFFPKVLCNMYAFSTFGRLDIVRLKFRSSAVALHVVSHGDSIRARDNDLDDQFSQGIGR
jgi:hypothetical protein